MNKSAKVNHEKNGRSIKLPEASWRNIFTLRITSNGSAFKVERKVGDKWEHDCKEQGSQGSYSYHMPQGMTYKEQQEYSRHYSEVMASQKHMAYFQSRDEAEKYIKNRYGECGYIEPAPAKPYEHV